jgi:NADH-quinone oxidoreductase subunit E
MAQLKILIVSGENDTARHLANSLASDGYASESVLSAADAHLFLARDRPDLTIVCDDIRDSRALAFLDEARMAIPELPVVVLARDPSVSEAVETMRHGACHYGGLSGSAEEFLRAVGAVLETKRDLLEEADRLRESRLVSFEDLKTIDVIDSIMERYGFRESRLVGILQDIQKELRYLPREALSHVAERLGVPLPRVYSVATFYQAFSLTPRGRHIIKVCMGTACHVRGAPKVLEELERKLGIGPGETTYDMEYTLITVNCLGCCALGPVVVVDEEYHSVKSWQLDSVLGLADYAKGAGAPDATAEAGGEDAR